MNEPIDPAAAAPPHAAPAAPPKPAKKEENFFVFLIKLVAIVLMFRSFIFAPFNIPSESMLPGLQNGDYLLAAKWPYGFSRHSLPLSVPLIPGRILASQPHRGDIAIFKAPPLNDTDYIKRVIGLPGDQVQMIAGTLYLNGAAIPKVRVADAVIPVSANTRCYLPVFETTEPDGSRTCHYPRFRETLPASAGEPGKTYYVLDLGRTPQDDTPPIMVPDGSLFMMGDNRDNSMDSRFDAVPGGGIGIVPQENLVGRATIMMFSTDGSASWLMPWTWFTATRWGRIGHTF